MKTGKVETLGAGPRIRELLAAGRVTCDDIARTLQAEGFALSRATVARWLKAEREERREETAQIVREHVQRVVPADLDALEEMETACLERSRETKGDFAHRLAESNIAADLDRWCDLFASVAADLRGADPEEGDKIRRQAVRSILTQCLAYVANDFQLEKMRTSARRTAALIIDLKLKHALGGEGASNVFIGPADGLAGREASECDAQPLPGGGRVLTFAGGD